MLPQIGRDLHCRYVDRFDPKCHVAREGHPLFAGGEVTPERYAASNHVVASRKGEFSSPVVDALEALGLTRTITVVVPELPDAMRIARCSDLIALVTLHCLDNRLMCDHGIVSGLQSFELPVRTPEIKISAQWHPRVDADPAHRWLRETIIALCKRAFP